MDILWTDIDDFPKYEISTEGVVVSKAHGREICISQNNYGTAKVNLMDKDGIFRTRAVNLLVAKAFVPNDNPYFNSVIHLNFDRMDNRVDNLVWRPRWFVNKYYWQRDNRFFDYPIRQGIYICDTGETFYTFGEIAMKYGMWIFPIMSNICNQQKTFPHGFIFEYGILEN